MRVLDIEKTQYTVSDFLSWQRDGTLELSPRFQRRPVWKPDAKSFFVDTVLRGLPAPVIYVRARVNLDEQDFRREIVDGQQRLRTLFSFIDGSSLDDFSPNHDVFTVKRVHNEEVAGLSYDDLPNEIKLQLLGYQFSTHVLPPTVEDREVLKIFARLNATGTKLTPQELRNAEWFGEFKTAMYELALEQLDRWRDWKILSDEQISRMKEVELTSDLIMSLMDGITGRRKKALDDMYERFDESFPEREEVSRRFRATMEAIDSSIGDCIKDTVYTSEVYFYTLFVFVYDALFAIGSPLDDRKPQRVARKTRAMLLQASEDFEHERVPPEVLDAARRASADPGRRKTRLDYMRSLMK